MKLVVIGGVAAGMSAAARARRLDEHAEIVVLERSAYVSFANCGLPYHVGGVIRDRDRLLLQTPEGLKASLALDVRTGHEAVAIDRAAHTVRVREVATGREYDERYDKLALCPGAQPIRPDLRGLDLPHVHVLRHVEDMDAILKDLDGGARQAVVVGAGYIGVEMAENLRHRGVAVNLVELADQVMPPLDREMVAPIEEHLRRHGVGLHLGTAAAEIGMAEGAGLSVRLRNGQVLRTDLVLLCAGVRPDVALARAAGLEIGPRGGIRVDEHQRTSDPDIYAAGDAVETAHAVFPGSWLVPLAGPANRQGRVVAENVCGRGTVYRSSQGTAIVKAFDLVAGGTGATEKALRREGRPYRKVYLHPSGHAGYYPGTAPMHLKLLFEPEGGRILGAQAVGYDGVDKRLDVLATALRAGMTVGDLEHLELAYAPPFGSAKDPVNMAGFIASNLLRGDLALWYAEDYPERTAGAALVDVRSPQEFETWHIPGAVNVPLGELRARAGELPKDRPIRLYCAVGFRSYLAHRALRQRGFADVATLAGGTTTFRQWHREIAGPPGSERPTPPCAGERTAAAAAPAGRTVELDCTGLACPGPILRLRDAMEPMRPGDELRVRVTDSGFLSDAPAWCRAQGHELVELRAEGAEVRARIRKGSGVGPAAPAAAGARPRKKTFVVFSGDLDRVMAAFILANGARAMGDQVTLFFTFWGLNALRRETPPPVRKGALDRMFGAMMPRGAAALKLSRLHMLGMGTAMMKKVMAGKGVASLPELVASARRAGVRMVACTMTMDVMRLRREELIEGLDYAGVAAFLGEADQSSATLFI